jgi:hypothetical protein
MEGGCGCQESTRTPTKKSREKRDVRENEQENKFRRE